MKPKEINLREVRDFGAKFNAVFMFVQTNFKPFIKVLLFSAGPLVLLGGVFFGMFYSKMLGSAFTSGYDPIFNQDGWGLVVYIMEMCLAYLLLGVASLWLIVAVNAYMAEYLEGNRDITLEAVWKRGKSKILPLVGFGLLIVCALLVITGILAFLFAEITGLMAITILLLIPCGIYVMVSCAFLPSVMMFENKPLFKSISRCFVLIKGEWWPTFGLMIVMGMMVNMSTMIFALPFYAVWIMSIVLHTGEVNSILVVISSCFMFTGSFLLSSLPILAIGLQYFNIVEGREGTGLLEQIDQIGKGENTANEGDY